MRSLPPTTLQANVGELDYASGMPGVNQSKWQSPPPPSPRRSFGRILFTSGSCGSSAGILSRSFPGIEKHLGNPQQELLLNVRFFGQQADRRPSAADHAICTAYCRHSSSSCLRLPFRNDAVRTFCRYSRLAFGRSKSRGASCTARCSTSSASSNCSDSSRL